ERGAQLGHAESPCVPRQHRLGKIELARVRAEDVERIVAERGERTGRAAELRREPLCGDALPHVDDPDEPARGLQAERRRHRLPPAITVERCASASFAHALAMPSSSPTTITVASRETSAAAVSRMSWLVAP